MSNKSSFERLDMFGVAVALKFAGSVKSKSKHGTFFTVIFVIFLIWAIIYSSSQLIARKDPRTITYDVFKEDPAEMTISKGTLPFAVGLKHSADMGFDHFVDESIYQIEIYQITLKAIDNGNGTFSQTRDVIPLDIEPCTSASFGELSSSFANLPLHLLYCLKQDQTYVKDIRIKGNTGSAFFQGITVSIKKCDPLTFSGGCAPDEEINKTLTAAYFQVYYPQLAINPKNSTHPDLKFRQDTITMVSPSYYKSGQITLGHVTVSSDYGWLVEDMQSKNYIQVNSLSEDLDLRPSQSGYLYDLLIFVDQLERNYERTYIKLQDILAQVQGLATAAIIVILLIINPYSQIKFHESLINELFDVKIKLKKKGDKNEYNQNSAKLSTRKEPKIEIEIPKSTLYSEAPIIVTEAQNLPTSVVNSPEITKELEEQQIPPPSSTRNLLSMTTQNPNSNPYSTAVTENSNKTRKNGGLARLCTIQEKLVEKESVKVESQGNKKTFMSRLTGNAQKAQKVENKDLTDVEEDIPNFISFNSENSFMKEIKENDDKDKDIPPVNNDLEKENHNEVQEVLPPPKTINYDNADKIIRKRKERLSRLKYESKKIHISFWDYLHSFVGNSETIKEKMGLLNKGVENIDERLDIFNILKKFREIDKLKALLLEDDQLVLFNAMPKPEIKLEDHMFMKEVSKRLIKSTTFVEGHEKHMVMISHQNLVEKPIKSKIDRKLLEIYDDSWIHENNK